MKDLCGQFVYKEIWTAPANKANDQVYTKFKRDTLNQIREKVRIPIWSGIWSVAAQPVVDEIWNKINENIDTQKDSL